jgi:hypothetical protein
VVETRSSGSVSGVDAERSRREREAYDEHGVDEAMAAWHGRFPHVFEGPNTLRAEVLTSSLRLDPHNALLRGCDRADEWIAKRGPRLRSHFRQTIVVIRKPAA